MIKGTLILNLKNNKSFEFIQVEDYFRFQLTRFLFFFN